jgi:hypothetical protein
VAEDVRNRALSLSAANLIYRVAYDPETDVVDHVETDRLRSEERKQRLELGKSFKKFVTEWSQLRPPDAILAVYGEWPSAVPGQPVMRM